MRPSLRLAFAAVSMAAVCSPAFAAGLTVPIDQSVRVDVAGAVNSLMVANPGVVDARVVDSHTFYLVGNGYGTTNIVALDRDGRAIYSADVVVTGGDTGVVSVYRGGARTDMACAPGCQVATRGTGGGGGGSGGGGGGGGGASMNPLTTAAAAAAPAPPP